MTSKSFSWRHNLKILNLKNLKNSFNKQKILLPSLTRQFLDRGEGEFLCCKNSPVDIELSPFLSEKSCVASKLGCNFILRCLYFTKKFSFRKILMTSLHVIWASKSKILDTPTSLLESEQLFLSTPEPELEQWQDSEELRSWGTFKIYRAPTPWFSGIVQ